MIGVLIFVGGVTAIVGMQGRALKVNHDSVQRSHAIWIANAASELIQANIAGLDAGTYQTVSTATRNIDTFCASSPVSCIGRSCSAAEMAEYDIYHLMCRDGSPLPNMIGAEIDIECLGTCSSGDIVQVSVSWDSRGAAGGVFSSRQKVNLSFGRE